MEEDEWKSEENRFYCLPSFPRGGYGLKPDCRASSTIPRQNGLVIRDLLLPNPYKPEIFKGDQVACP